MATVTMLRDVQKTAWLHANCLFIAGTGERVEPS